MQVLAISRYDGRGAITLQDSVKSQHILPFFPNFVAWARRLEELLVGTDAEAECAAWLPACLPWACACHVLNWQASGRYAAVAAVLAMQLVLELYTAAQPAGWTLRGFS